MSSKRKSLPSKVLESFGNEANDMVVDSASDEANPPLLPLLATPDHSDSSVPGSDYSACGREENLPPTSSPAGRWGDADVTSSESLSKRCRRESEDLSHFPSFTNPFLQARLQEARLQQEQVRLLQEAAIRQDQQHQLHHHEQQQQQQQMLRQTQKPPFFPPTSQPHFNTRVSPENEHLSNFLATKKSMDDVLKKLTSKMSHNSIEENAKLRNEK